MIKKAYRISFEVPEAQLSTIVGLISGEVSNMTIRDTATIATNATKAELPQQPRRRVYNNFGRTSPVQDAVHAFLRSRPIDGAHVSYGALAIAIQDAGGSETSASPVISRLARDGLIRRVGHNQFQIIAHPKPERSRA